MSTGFGTSSAKRTPLCSLHEQLGGKMVDFGGWQMPLQYSGIVDEHRAVRGAVGLFDVSHMGEIEFRGARAADAVRGLVSNDVYRLRDGEALYTVICNPSGGIVDDCLVYRFAPERYVIVVNAANIDKDRDWFVANAAGQCEIRDLSDQTGLLALQGPRAEVTLASLCTRRLSGVRPFTHFADRVAGLEVTVARTGYTGEDGFEIFCRSEDATRLWQALMDAGRAHGIKPAGLGARDTLRLEARLCLWGQDIDDTTSPLEAGLGWVVKLDSGEFIGKQSLLEEKQRGVRRRLAGLVIRERGIARHGYPILAVAGGDHAGESAVRSGDGAGGGSAGVNEVGRVTSGTTAPSLGYAVAMGYVPTELAEPGTRLFIDCRGKQVSAQVVKGPFYKRVVPTDKVV